MDVDGVMKKGIHIAFCVNTRIFENLDRDALEFNDKKCVCARKEPDTVSYINILGGNKITRKNSRGNAVIRVRRRLSAHIWSTNGRGLPCLRFPTKAKKIMVKLIRETECKRVVGNI